MRHTLAVVLALLLPVTVLAQAPPDAETPVDYESGRTGSAATADALAANPSDCAANQFATTIAASGNLTCAQPAVSNLSDGSTGSGAVVLASTPTLSNPSLGTGYLSSTKTAGSTGTTANLLVKLDSSGNVVTLGTSDTSGALGIALSTRTSGQALEVATRGIVPCVADNTTTIGNLLGVGTSTGGRCKDLGQTITNSVSPALQIVGKALSAVSAGSNVSVQLYGPGHYGSSAPAVTAGKTVTVANSIAFAGTDSTTMTFPSTSGTVSTESGQVGTGGMTGNLCRVLQTNSCFYANATGVATTGTSEEVLLTCTIKGGTLTTDLGSVLRFSAEGAHTAGNANAASMRARWGGIGGTIVTTASSSAANGRLNLSGNILRVSNTSQIVDGGGVNASPVASQTLSGDVTLVITGTTGSGAGDVSAVSLFVQACN